MAGEPTDSRKAATILCVDDDWVARRLCAAIFERAGRPCVCAADGLEAAALAAKDPGRFRLVLTDHDMPGMNGVGLVTALREMGATAPIVVVSAGLEPQDRFLYGRLGVEHFVAKPVDSRELVALVERLAGRAG